MLVHMVFFDSARLSVPVTRIEASGFFLARCAGEPGTSAAAVQRAFTVAFGKNAPSIRRRYAEGYSNAAEAKRLGYPANFADLYLTLLAASADDSTQGEGNFRRRFVELLHPLPITPPDFGGLSTLWQRVADWSKRRAASHGDCRVLRLPSAGREKLIGISKRLSFPSYLDEMKLADCLKTARATSLTGFNTVTAIVVRTISSFSPVFQDEFGAFVKQLRLNQFQDAYESPFWSAVLSITWEAERNGNSTSGIFRLLMCASDPQSPEFYLLADGRGKTLLAQHEAVQALGSAAEYVILPPAGKAWSLDTLCTVARGPAAAARLWRLLKLGCLFLLPDGKDGLSSDGQHYSGGPASILIAGDAAKLLVRAAHSLGIRHSFVPLDARVHWHALVMPGVSADALIRLAENLPSELQTAFPSAWTAPRIRLAGAAWFGQYLLLNPASIPFVRLEGAESGVFEVRNDAGAILSSGSLASTEDGFTVPPESLASCEAASTICFHLNGSASNDSCDVQVAGAFPLMLPAPLADPSAWLTDGRSGKLSPAYSGHTAHDSLAEICLPLFSSGDGISALESQRVNLAQPLSWIAEALRLRYQSRASLSFDDAMAHIAPACGAAGIPAWRLRRLLFAGGWLIAAQRRTSRFSSVLMASRTLSFARAAEPGGLQVRIAGMFSSSEIGMIKSYLGTACNLRRLHSATQSFGLGALTAEVLSEDSARQMASALGLEVIEESIFGPPFSVIDAGQIPWATVAPVLPKDFVEIWSTGSSSWMSVTDTSSPYQPGTMFCIRGSQRIAFWIAVPGGYWKTDSLAWAHMLRLAAASGSIGCVGPDGSCRFKQGLLSLPGSLIKWWLHWGGGYVGILDSGEIYLGGDASVEVWKTLGAWFEQHPAKKDVHRRHIAAETRWQLARRLLRARRSAVTELGDE